MILEGRKIRLKYKLTDEVMINNIFRDETSYFEQSIIRKTKRNHLFKRSDKTRKTKCTFEESPFFLRLRTK